MSHLITVDVGNVGIKYRSEGRAWTVEPSVVRTVGTGGYALVSGPALRPLTYESGPAELGSEPVIVGTTARHGQTDLAIVGSAEARVRSAAYLYLHLYAILASLPAGVTDAAIDFAGGLPVADTVNGSSADLLRSRLKGAHTLRWGAMVYRIKIDRILLVPQPIGAIATTMFTPDGKVKPDALSRTRFVLDVGGGTTDYTGRTGLELLAGTEGGMRIGVMDAARRARERIQARAPRLRNLTDADVLRLIREGTAALPYQGDTLDVRGDIEAGIAQTAASILAEVLPCWERQLETGEVLICGGGGQLMAGAFSHELGALTRVTLLSDPIFRIADGLERLARNRLAG